MGADWVCVEAGWVSGEDVVAFLACDFERLARAPGVSVGKWYFVVMRVWRDVRLFLDKVLRGLVCRKERECVCV